MADRSRPGPTPHQVAQLRALDEEVARGAVSMVDYWRRRHAIDAGLGDPGRPGAPQPGPAPVPPPQAPAQATAQTSGRTTAQPPQAPRAAPLASYAPPSAVGEDAPRYGGDGSWPAPHAPARHTTAHPSLPAQQPQLTPQQPPLRPGPWQQAPAQQAQQQEAPPPQAHQHPSPQQHPPYQQGLGQQGPGQQAAYRQPGFPPTPTPRQSPFAPPAGAVEVRGVDLTGTSPPPVPVPKRRPAPPAKKRRWFHRKS